MTLVPEFHELEKLIYNVMHKLYLPPPYDDYFQESYLVYHAAKARYDPTRSQFSSYYHSKLEYHFLTLVSNEQKRTHAQDHLHRCLPPNHLLPSVRLYLPPCLSPCEQRILSDLLKGYKNIEIAYRLKISPSTFYRRRRTLRAKLARLRM
ncbi:LuxR C-terminal-related transcriptional regulator [Halobacillus litoralis]|uniref:LuxR C-terminal-related transcriptional regulator n=1 Tax=Halobacillus litoralis TaxID=45668 RepID=UPI00136F02C3|nr:LuxR C-terminal-related transcriptional regulator [Halobacillus litoralis]MYL36471.1 hypothetical protein [Halobacillus litoralis]